MATSRVFDQNDPDELDSLVADLRPDGGRVRLIPQEPQPDPQTPLMQLQDEVTASVEAVREELKALAEKLEPVLTPKGEEPPRGAAPGTGPRSKMAGSLATWRDELLVLSNDVREVTARVEL